MAEQHPKALELKQLITDLLQEGREKNWFAPAFVYQFFPASSNGNDLHIYDPEAPDRVIETFNFQDRKNFRTGLFLIMCGKAERTRKIISPYLQ